MMITAKDLMTAKPHCCLPEDSVYEAASIMRDQDVGIVPVINREGHCVGVVTDRDLCLKMILEGRDAERTKVQEVMTHNPLTCHEEDSLEQVVRKMEQRRVRRILVEDHLGQCIGIISEADIALNQVDPKALSAFLAAVSR